MPIRLRKKYHEAEGVYWNGVDLLDIVNFVLAPDGRQLSELPDEDVLSDLEVKIVDEPRGLIEVLGREVRRGQWLLRAETGIHALDREDVEREYDILGDAPVPADFELLVRVVNGSLVADIKESESNITKQERGEVGRYLVDYGERLRDSDTAEEDD